jgi:hypothetical protein
MPYNEEDMAVINKVKDWRGATHFGDPAGRSANQVSGTSVIERLADFNIYVSSNTKANDLESRKSATAKLLMNFDVNDTPHTRYWLECMKNSRYPEVKDGSQRTNENSKPIHDWTSHMRTMTEYFAVNFKFDPRSIEPDGLTFQKAMAQVQLKKQKQHIIGKH